MDSESELAWYFCQRASELGLHGQSYESNGVSVWDDARVDRAHLSKLEEQHRGALRREREIRPIVEEKLSSYHQAITKAAFSTSGQWSQPLRSAFQLADGRPTLVGVALICPAAIELYANAIDSHQCRSSEVLATFLDTIAKTYSRKLQPVQEQARRVYGAALEEYEGYRRAREELKRQEERERKSMHISSHRSLLRGLS